MSDFKEKYGHDYGAHLLEQYRLCVQMADKVNSRRHASGIFFMAINAFIIALPGYMDIASRSAFNFYLLVSLVGMVLCFAWHSLLQYYRNLYLAKLEVICEIEAGLPISPHEVELSKTDRGGTASRLNFDKFDNFLPWIFFTIQASVFVAALFALAGLLA